MPKRFRRWIGPKTVKIRLLWHYRATRPVVLICILQSVALVLGLVYLYPQSNTKTLLGVSNTLFQVLGTIFGFIVVALVLSAQNANTAMNRLDDLSSAYHKLLAQGGLQEGRGGHDWFGIEELRQELVKMLWVGSLDKTNPRIRHTFEYISALTLVANQDNRLRVQADWSRLYNAHINETSTNEWRYVENNFLIGMSNSRGFFQVLRYTMHMIVRSAGEDFNWPQPIREFGFRLRDNLIWDRIHEALESLERHDRLTGNLFWVTITCLGITIFGGFGLALSFTESSQVTSPNIILSAASIFTMATICLLLTVVYLARVFID